MTTQLTPRQELAARFVEAAIRSDASSTLVDRFGIRNERVIAALALADAILAADSSKPATCGKHVYAKNCDCRQEPAAAGQEPGPDLRALLVEASGLLFQYRNPGDSRMRREQNEHADALLARISAAIGKQGVVG